MSAAPASSLGGGLGFSQLPAGGNQPSAVESFFSLACDPLGSTNDVGDSAAAAVLRYKVHPVVIFSILDHFKRRNQGADRVSGVLLGIRRRNDVYITNCFALPHNLHQKRSEATEYYKRMVDLLGQVNADESVVGWYGTGESLGPAAVQELQFFADPARVNTGIVQEPLHLLVDTGLLKDKFGMKGFLGKTVFLNEQPLVCRFEPTVLQLHASEAEKIGVDALITSRPDQEDGPMDAPATVLSNYQNIEQSVDKLLHLIEQASEHAQAVAEGKVEGDPEIGRQLADAISAIPFLEPDRFDQVFQSSLQDMLMVMQLSGLTRTHLALADKVTGLLPGN